MACAFLAARLFSCFSQMSVDLPFQTYYVLSYILTLEPNNSLHVAVSGSAFVAGLGRCAASSPQHLLAPGFWARISGFGDFTLSPAHTAEEVAGHGRGVWPQPFWDLGLGWSLPGLCSRSLHSLGHLQGPVAPSRVALCLWSSAGLHRPQWHRIID